MLDGVGLTKEEYDAKICATEDGQSDGVGRASRRARSSTDKQQQPQSSKLQAVKKRAIETKKPKAASKPAPAKKRANETKKLKVTSKPATVKAANGEVRDKVKSKKQAILPQPKKTKKSMDVDVKKTEKPSSKKRAQADSSSDVRKKQKHLTEPEAIDVQFRAVHDETNQAPWEVSPLPSHIHSIVTEAGFTYSSNYYLPGESYKNFTHRFASAHDAIKYVATTGNIDLSTATPEARIVVERLIDYAHVPEKQSDWRKIRALKTHETITFLKALGYKPMYDGPWTVPEAMVEHLKQDKFASLEELILALRRSPTLVPQKKRGRGTANCILTKDQLLALRLRIAEGAERRCR